MSNCMPKGQREYIDKIQKDCLESTNMTESEAYSFAFRCWQMDYIKADAISKISKKQIEINELIKGLDKMEDTYRKLYSKRLEEYDRGFADGLEYALWELRGEADD